MGLEDARKADVVARSVQKAMPYTDYTNFPAVTATLGRLSIAAFSTLLARLDVTMRCLGWNTLV